MCIVVFYVKDYSKILNIDGKLAVLHGPNGVFPKYFTKFAKFSDKNICHYSKKASNLPPLMEETRLVPQHQQDTCERQDL